MKTVKRVLMPAALVALLATCGDPDAPQPDMIQVWDNEFMPREYNTRVGNTVWWVWSGRVAHDVRFGDGGSSSPVMLIGDFRRTFSSAGRFDYICTLHAGMVGTIFVGP